MHQVGVHCQSLSGSCEADPFNEWKARCFFTIVHFGSKQERCPRLIRALEIRCRPSVTSSLTGNVDRAMIMQDEAHRKHLTGN
jgi:hypothetical protein